MAASVVIKKLFRNNIWDKLLKNGPSKICGRQPLKNFTWSILEYFVSYKGHLKLHVLRLFLGSSF